MLHNTKIVTYVLPGSLFQVDLCFLWVNISEDNFSCIVLNFVGKRGNQASWVERRLLSLRKIGTLAEWYVTVKNIFASTDTKERLWPLDSELFPFMKNPFLERDRATGITTPKQKLALFWNGGKSTKCIYFRCHISTEVTLFYLVHLTFFSCLLTPDKTPPMKDPIPAPIASPIFPWCGWKWKYVPECWMGTDTRNRFCKGSAEVSRLFFCFSMYQVPCKIDPFLTPLYSEWPNLNGVWAVLSAVGLNLLLRL